MSQYLAALALCLAVSAAAPAQGPAKPDPLPDILRKLSAEKGPSSEVIPDVSVVSLEELAATVTKLYSIPVVIPRTQFADATFKERKPDLVSGKLEGLSLRSYLDTVLRACGAVALVRKDQIEIVPAQHAAREAGVEVLKDDFVTILAQPLVSAVIKEKPLNEAVAAVAEEFDLTVVVAPQAADNRTGFVSARLLNVPADRALELLAVQADLRVVKRGNAFLVTSRDHANALADEAVEAERRKAEVKQLRTQGPPPPPPAPPEPPKPGM